MISAGKNNKHTKNRVFLITDTVVKQELKIQHKGTKEIWDDMNTNLLQGVKIRATRSQVMGIEVECDDNMERRRTHSLLMYKVEPIYYVVG